MEFFSDKLLMKPGQSQLAIRISTKNPVESFITSKWKFGMQRVEEFENDFGIYAINLYHFIYGFDWYFRVLIAQSRNIENIMVILLDVDKSSVIKDDSLMELSFHRANIIKEMPLSDFRKYIFSHRGFDHGYSLDMIESSIQASHLLTKKDYSGWATIMGKAKWDMYQKIWSNFKFEIIKPRVSMSIDEHICDCLDMVKAIEKLHILRTSNSNSLDELWHIIKTFNIDNNA